MSIDFTLTPDQQELQKIARAFSEDALKPVVKEADLEPDTQKAFQMMKGPYKEAYKLGFAMGFLPKEYGGGGGRTLAPPTCAAGTTPLPPPVPPIPLSTRRPL